MGHLINTHILVLLFNLNKRKEKKFPSFFLPCATPFPLHFPFLFSPSPYPSLQPHVLLPRSPVTAATPSHLRQIEPSTRFVCSFLRSPKPNPTATLSFSSSIQNRRYNCRPPSLSPSKPRPPREPVTTVSLRAVVQICNAGSPPVAPSQLFCRRLSFRYEPCSIQQLCIVKSSSIAQLLVFQSWVRHPSLL